MTLLALLPACSQLADQGPGVSPGGPQPYGVLSGSVILRGLGGSPMQTLGASVDGPVVPGELIVGFDLARTMRTPAMVATAAGPASFVRELALPGVALYRVAGLDAASTRAAAVALSARSEVRFAQPNALRYPVATPNDPYRSMQWALSALHLPAAWDVETGSPSTVIAIVDTGILFRPGDPAASHPDLTGRVVAGYDFISDPSRANDGDGRDADPYDDGDVASGQASYHGSHVASIAAAATDNGVGMSGVDWSAQVLPVRVLGVGGGTVADVVDGLLWAVGRSVQGVPVNPWPADVVNLSLGGAGACSAVEQAAIDAAAAEGASVVVAAGNDDADAGGESPANCLGVITVGATDGLDERAWYSNYGSVIDVMAPGGDTSVDADNDGFLDGVLGAHRDDEADAFDYVLYQGTSMAAAQVSGIVALIRARDGTLSPVDVEALLESTAQPLDDNACGAPRAGPGACGAGLVDALAAVEQAPGFEPPAGDIVFDPPTIAFGSAQSLAALALTNVGGVDLSWSFRGVEQASGDPAPLPDGIVGIAKGSPDRGTLGPGERVTTNVVLDRASVTVAGVYHLTLVFDTSAGEERVPATFEQGAGVSPLTGPMRVIAWQQVGTGKRLLTGLAESDPPAPSFSLVASAGETQLFAWTDENANDVIDAGDGFGALAAPVTVVPGSVTTGLVLVVDRLASAPTWRQDLPRPP